MTAAGALCFLSGYPGHSPGDPQAGMESGSKSASCWGAAWRGIDRRIVPTRGDCREPYIQTVEGTSGSQQEVADRQYGARRRHGAHLMVANVANFSTAAHYAVMPYTGRKRFSSLA